MIDKKFADTSRTKICGSCGEEYYRDKRCTFAHWGKSKFCSRDCYGVNNAKRLASIRPNFVDKFWSFVDKSGDCWEWTSLRDRDGYGLFNYKRVSYRAARESLKMSGVAVADDEYCCHKCDNPLCVRPDHLYAGTPKQNMRDAIERGRLQVGENHYAAKLTEKDVLEIRACEGTLASIGERYGVNPSNVGMIRAGKTWKHLL